jgi:hypothetical protein
MLSKHQQHAVETLKKTFGENSFTEDQCWGIGIRRPAYTLELLFKKGKLTREKNPERSILGWTFWLWKVAA